MKKEILFFNIMNREIYRKEFNKCISQHVFISEEDLTKTEKEIINKAYELFIDKIEEIKVLQDDNNRLLIELSNMKSMGTIDELIQEYNTTDKCPICKKAREDEDI